MVNHMSLGIYVMIIINKWLPSEVIFVFSNLALIATHVFPDFFYHDSLFNCLFFFLNWFNSKLKNAGLHLSSSQQNKTLKWANELCMLCTCTTKDFPRLYTFWYYCTYKLAAAGIVLIKCLVSYKWLHICIPTLVWGQTQGYRYSCP